tara:strand:+ start:22395 stop:24599 length:2205 start_codon:yes stop_codon:yes gene_type:complete
LFLRIILIFIIFCNLKVYAKCNFKTADFIDQLNNPRKITQIKITTPKIKKFRKNQLNILVSNNYVIPKKFKKYFKSKIIVSYTFGECHYDGKIRQHGDWNDHIVLDAGNVKSSIRVKLKEGNIMNAVRFTLLLPDTRYDLNEILGSLLLKNIGFIVPETFQVKTDINGFKSVMLFQEVARKELLERNNRREGPILEGDESILWGDNYIINENHEFSFARVENQNWFLKGKNSAKITLEAFHKLQNAYLEHWHSKNDLKRIIMSPNYRNNELFSKYFFSLLALKGEHALYAHNRKFYFNPITKIFEPIYYDGDLSLKKKTKDDDHIINKEKIYAAKNFYKIDKSNFKKNFTNLSNKNEIFNSFLNRVKVDEKKVQTFFEKSLKNIELNEKIIENYINSTPYNDSWKRNIKNDYDSYISKLNHLTEIDQVTISEIFDNNQNFISLSSENENYFFTKEEIAEIISKNKLNNQRYVYIPNQEYDEKLYSNFAKISEVFNGYLKYSKNLFINIDYENKLINLKQNNPDDWILFVDTDIEEWTILFEGIKPNKKNLNFERINNYGLTGCLNFYNSTFKHSSIKVINGKCEDSLNIINSEGLINKIEIENSYSDGLDVDFSNIKFNLISILNSRNDCLDVSAGNYKIEKIKAKICGDKGVSVGEKSNMSIELLEIDDATIGLSSKDSSITSIKNYYQKNVNNCFEVMKKKQEFGGAELILRKDKCDNNVIDNNSRINLNKS